MGATSEQMVLVDSSALDHVSYILILLSIACIVFLFANVLIHLYDRLANDHAENTKAYANGHAAAEDGRAREAEEFELHGLMSDDDDDDENDNNTGESRRMLAREEDSGPSFESSSPSTVGKNNQGRA